MPISLRLNKMAKLHIFPWKSNGPTDGGDYEDNNRCIDIRPENEDDYR